MGSEMSGYTQIVMRKLSRWDGMGRRSFPAGGTPSRTLLKILGDVNREHFMRLLRDLARSLSGEYSE